MGHEVTVFAPIGERGRGGIPLDVVDESFVHRNWEFYRYGDRIVDDNELDLYFDPSPILHENFDIFVIEKPSSTPIGKLLKILPEIKNKGPVIAVMHEGRRIINKNFYKADFDIYTLFDERFEKLFKNLLPEDKTFIVPFPCHPIIEGNMMEAREKLELPSDEDLKIILAFGIRLKYLREILPIFKKLSKKYNIMLLLLSKHPESVSTGKEITKHYDFTVFKYEAPPIERLYTYLHASNVVLLHRGPTKDYIPVSSTVNLCLGALRPILCPDNNFFETFKDEVIKYSGIKELEEKLGNVLENVGIDGTLKAARKYLEDNSAGKVAQKLLEFTDSLEQITVLSSSKIKVSGIS